MISEFVLSEGSPKRYVLRCPIGTIYSYAITEVSVQALQDARRCTIGDKLHRIDVIPSSFWQLPFIKSIKEQ